MLGLAFFAFSVVMIISFIVNWWHSKSKSQPSIPGLVPSSKENGNSEDIANAGSFHEFLVGLHRKFGPIVSYWFGPQLVVSIADARFFKEQINLFDRPPILYKLFEPLVGPQSITYANGDDGQIRRNTYDRAFTHDAIKKYFVTFQQIADGMVKKLESYQPTDHVSVTEYMLEFALKADLEVLFGEHLEEAVIHRFKSVYDVAWGEVEERLREPTTPAREERFQRAKQELMRISKEIVRDRKKLPTEHGEEYFIDLIMDFTDDEEQHFSETLSFILAGFHTTGFFLTWAFYFLATHPGVQDKVYEEIREVLGAEDVDFTNMTELRYLRQVQDETLRCSVLAPYAARVQHVDSEICGYKVPKDTPVMHAIGVASFDEKVWPSPHEFDPERFSPENVASRPHLAFIPFGFAGKRVCPGQRFVYAEASVAMVTVLREFRVQAVKGPKVGMVHGLVTKPSEEIWVTLSRR